MKIIAITEKGSNKGENEDRIIVGRSVLASGTLVTDFEAGCLAVADGVGGNRAGAMASHFVAKELCTLSEISTEALLDINKRLLDAANSAVRYRGMATTLAGVWVCAHSGCLFSAGNSRVYLLQGGKYLKQLTTDDTTLNYLLATGQMTLREAPDFARKNEITACFGGGDPNLCRVRVRNMETVSGPVLLTSDGIHDYLSLDEMEELIGQYGLTVEACAAMIALARENGSVDDASIILGCV